MRSTRIGFFVAAFSGIVSVSGQTLKNSDTLAFFELIFTGQNFDTVYSSHSNARPGSFFLIDDGPVKQLIQGFPAEKTVFELHNGNILAFNSKGRMFVSGVKHYIKFTRCIVEEDEALFTLEGIEFNGFNEKILTQQELKFMKVNGNWRRKSEKK